MVHILYKIRRSWRTTRIRISVRRNATVVVTIPFFLPTAFAEKFVRTHQKWIREKVYALQKKETQNQNHPTYQKSKAAARTYITELIENYTKKYNFTYNRISIKNHASRWGSCSRKKNLNFNYRLLFLPKELAEYVVVHELCHLEHLNHSPQFWQKVGEIMPDYKIARRALKKVH